MSLTRRSQLLAGLGAALLFSSLTGCAPKKTIAGDWTGPLDITNPMTGGKISMHLTRHVVQEDNGTYNATLDVPEQKAMGIKLDSLAVKDSDVNISLNFGPAHASYTGKIDANYAKITGQWSQAGMNFPLEFSKDSDKPTASGTVNSSNKK